MSKVTLPEGIVKYIEMCTLSYGKVKLVLKVETIRYSVHLLTVQSANSVHLLIVRTFLQCASYGKVKL